MNFSKEHFIKYLKSLINNDYRENLKDFFLEKEIDIWNEFEKNKEIDLEFVTNGLKCNIEIEQRGETICAGISKTDLNWNFKCVMFFRHCTDYSRNVTRVLSKRHINNKDFFFNRFNDNNHLVENGKVVCGVYIRIVESEKREKYLEELRSLINDDNQDIIQDNYFEYVIGKWENFNEDRLTKYIYPNSETWRIRFYRTRYDDPNDAYISFRLKNMSIWEGYPPYYANIVLSFRNIDDESCYKAKLITPKITFFNRYNCKLRYPDFTKESELHLKNELNKSIIENNKTMVGFYIRYYKSDKKPSIINYELDNLIKHSIENQLKMINDTKFMDEESEDMDYPLNEIVVHKYNKTLADLNRQKRTLKYVINLYVRYFILILIILTFLFYQMLFY